MNEYNYQLRSATVDMLMRYRQHCTHAVTLTMKQGIWVSNSKGHSYIKLTPQLASRNLRYALNRINRYFYGNGYKRKPDHYSLLVISSLEGQQYRQRMHYHLQLGNLPTDCTNEDLGKALTEAWSATDFGYTQKDLQALYGTHWLNYMTKEISARNDDCMDWNNVCVPLRYRSN